MDVQQIVLIVFKVPELDSALKRAGGQDAFGHSDDTTSPVATTQLGLGKISVCGGKKMIEYDV